MMFVNSADRFCMQHLYKMYDGWNLPLHATAYCSLATLVETLHATSNVDCVEIVI
jgi:hypothetical protein